MKKNKFQSSMAVTTREARGFTQTSLSRAIGVSQSKVSKWESGLSVPTETEMESLVSVLGYSREVYFVDYPEVGLGLPEFYHRQLSTARKTDVRAIHAKSKLIAVGLERLLRAESTDIEFGPLDLDIESFGGDVEKIACLVRAFWDVPPGPIKDLVTLIESKGGIVIDRDLESNKVDALCHWPTRLPPIFYINSSKPACRVRFSLAHELGHTILHQKPADNHVAEDEANRFAAEFMMPARDISQELRPSLKPADLARAKERWRMSMASILQRAKILRRITDSRFKSLRVYFSKRGWNRNEPVQIEREHPQRFVRLLNMHLTELDYTNSDLAELLFVKELDELNDMIQFRPPVAPAGDKFDLRLVR